jgi:hypothetical protein
MALEVVSEESLTPREAVVFLTELGYEFIDPESRAMLYDIALSECRDAAAALTHIEHMADKTWVTVQHLGEFASLAIQKMGLEASR